MGVMAKLMRRDALLLVSRLRGELLSLFGISGIFALFVYFQKMDPATLELFFGTMLAVSLTQQMVSLMQLDLNGVFPLIEQLPVDRRTYRRSRYLCAALLTLAAYPLAIVSQSVIRIVMGSARLDMGLYLMLPGVSCALLLPGYLCGERLRQWMLHYGQVVIILFQSLACGGLGALALAVTLQAAEPLKTRTGFYLMAGLGALLLSMAAVECYHRRAERSALRRRELPSQI